MSTTLGSGEHRYRVVENWAKLPEGWRLTDVASVAVDSKDRIYVFNRGAHPMVVLATGYKRQEELVRKLFGDDVTDRVGVIWGFGEEQELRNMYTRTGQRGLWLIAGGLAQCRIGSKHLALQIKAIEEGLLPRDVGPRAALG